ncbi:MAG: hypothetical protein EOO56_15720 [Hymenobacter sp.]|nr:MAG: hypothetical protein EOO56_15720 [Hymenobacter sp.]
MTILIESPLFALAHDPSCACLYATWEGHHTTPITQANYELIFWFVRITGSTKLLNDGLLDQNGWQEATAWLAQDCFRRLAQEGITAVAWVLPRDTEALRDTRKLLALLEQPLVGTFGDSEAAYNWLHQWPRIASRCPSPPEKGTDSYN